MEIGRILIVALTCVVSGITCLPAPEPATRALTGHCDVLCTDEEIYNTQVCGSDGVTYDSRCDFDNAACLAAEKHIRLALVRRNGPCITMNSPCSEIYTPGFYCGTMGTPVCGSDGTTYQNECYLFSAHCRSLQSQAAEVLTLANKGQCQELKNGSREVDCNQYVAPHSGMIAVEGGGPLAAKIDHCPSHFEPVCSPEGGTYVNECNYCRHLTLYHKLSYDNMVVSIAHDGTCYLHGSHGIG